MCVIEGATLRAWQKMRKLSSGLTVAQRLTKYSANDSDRALRCCLRRASAVAECCCPEAAPALLCRAGPAGGFALPAAAAGATSVVPARCAAGHDPGAGKSSDCGAAEVPSFAALGC